MKNLPVKFHFVHNPIFTAKLELIQAGFNTLSRTVVLTKALKGFCFTCEYIEELNPADQCNSGGGTRILKRITDPVTGKTKSTDMIYLRTITEARRMEQPPAVEPKQGDLFTPPTDDEDSPF